MSKLLRRTCKRASLDGSYHSLGRPVFLKELATVEYINLFVSELSNEDVTASMYMIAQTSPIAKDAKRVGKVDSICRGIVLELKKLDQSKYLHAILAALVRMDVPSLGLVLGWLCDMS